MPEPPDDAAVQRLLDAVVRREAGVSRARARWLYRRAEEESTFAAVLEGLMERADHVVVGTRPGVTYRGRIAAVGHDFVVVATDSTALPVAVVRLEAVTSVRSAGAGTPTASGGQHSVRDMMFSELLAGLAADRDDVVVRVEGEDAGLAGRLVSAGADVVRLQLSTPDATQVHLPIAGCVAIACRGL